MNIHDKFIYGYLVSILSFRRFLKMVGWEVPIGAAIAFAGGAIATGWAQSRIGAAGAGAIAEKPETAGTIIIIEAIPETLVILGFVIASMIILMVK
jgi:V/A-type H+-transporting ATPase subunit K